MTNTPALESFNFGKLLLLLLFIQEEKTWLKFNFCPRVDINFHNSLNLHPFASPVRELYYSCKEQGGFGDSAGSWPERNGGEELVRGRAQRRWWS